MTWADQRDGDGDPPRDADDGDELSEKLDADVALPDGCRATDGGNADRLIALHGDHLRHVAVWRKWCCWDGCRWRIDYGDRLTLGRARDVVRHLIRLAAGIGDAKVAGMVIGFALRTESARQLRALVDVAASTPCTKLDHEDLDADGWLLNLPNGTLDLRTRELHVHRLDLDAPDRVFTGLPSDRGHFAEPYFDHVLRGLRREPPEYVAAVLEGVQMDELAQELEGIEGLVIFEDLEAD